MPNKLEIKIEKQARDRKIRKDIEPKNSSGFFADYMRFGESYTSLILGIIAVILVTILLLAFVRNRTIQPTNEQDLQSRSSQTQGYQNNTPSQAVGVNTVTQVIANPSPTRIIVSVTPTLIPTVSTTISQPSPTQEVAMNKSQSQSIEKSHTVSQGENLWIIAQKEYKSGYNWVDIARANNLSNPNSVETGQKLVLPKVDQKNATSEPEYSPKMVSSTMTSSLGTKITTENYTIVKGDSLWSIAVRAYGDGYQWVKISRANNLSNPDLILPGSKLTIPRL